MPLRKLAMMLVSVISLVVVGYATGWIAGELIWGRGDHVGIARHPVETSARRKAYARRLARITHYAVTVGWRRVASVGWSNALTARGWKLLTGKVPSILGDAE